MIAAVCALASAFLSGAGATAAPVTTPHVTSELVAQTAAVGAAL